MLDALAAILAADEEARARLGAAEARLRARVAELRARLDEERAAARAQLAEALETEVRAIREDAERECAERQQRRAHAAELGAAAVNARSSDGVDRLVAILTTPAREREAP